MTKRKWIETKKMKRHAEVKKKSGGDGAWGGGGQRGQEGEGIQSDRNWDR